MAQTQSNEKVKLASYNKNWPFFFNALADNLRKALGTNCVALHHIGSTSVPELSAKPKIDICLQVKHAKIALPQLESLGYVFNGEWNIPFKYGFTYRHDIKANLHMFDTEHPAIESNLLFRNYLREHAPARNSYAKLKYKLAESEDSHLKQNGFFKNYTLGKSIFIKNVLRQAGFKRDVIQFCSDNQEWQTAKKWREVYIFTPNNMEDPYTWTFNHKDHKHLIFYKGVDIIGYAHVQLWHGQRAILHNIVIDLPYRGKNHGQQFVALIEDWLKFKGYKIIHTKISNQEALRFYQYLHYQRMPYEYPDGFESSSNDVTLGKLL